MLAQRAVTTTTRRLLSAPRRMASVSAAASPPQQQHASKSPEAVVQRQLEAYNSRDLEQFMALMHPDCVAEDYTTGAVIAQGTAQLTERYRQRFQTAVHSELLGRLCLGDHVVDREIITGLPDGAAADCLATYTVQDGLITKMAFVWTPRS